MNDLTTKQVYVGPLPPPPPMQSFTFPKPLSYNFRVAEHVDESGEVIKVGLQVEVWEHDEYGVGTVKYTWIDVPRVKLMNGILQND
jgi:hypothetical protein